MTYSCENGTITRSRWGVLPAMILLFGCIVGDAWSKTVNHVKTLACYRDLASNEVFVAVAITAPRFLPDTLSKQGGTLDYNSEFAVSRNTGNGNVIVRPTDGLIVNALADFNYEAAKKYNLMNYVLVIDTSGSIKDHDLGEVKGVLGEFIGKMPEAATGSIIKFSDDVDVSPSTKEKEELIRDINAQDVRQGTALFDAVMTGAHTLSKMPEAPLRVMVVFTDGKDTNSEQYNSLPRLLQTFKQVAKQEEIVPLIIGVGEADETVLKEIKETARFGEYIYIPDFSKFRGVVDQLESLLNNTLILQFTSFGPADDVEAYNLVKLSQSTGSIQDTIGEVKCDFR